MCNDTRVAGGGCKAQGRPSLRSMSLQDPINTPLANCGNRTDRYGSAARNNREGSSFIGLQLRENDFCRTGADDTNWDPELIFGRVYTQ